MDGSNEWVGGLNEYTQSPLIPDASMGTPLCRHELATQLTNY